MIEKKESVDNLEDILSVRGIDIVQFGPCDYSLSVGLPGQQSNPKVKKAELRVVETALRMGIHPRAAINNLENVERYIDLGVRDFNLPTEATIIYEWLKKNGESLRKILSRI